MGPKRPHAMSSIPKDAVTSESKPLTGTDHCVLWVFDSYFWPGNKVPQETCSAPLHPVVITCLLFFLT